MGWVGAEGPQSQSQILSPAWFWPGRNLLQGVVGERAAEVATPQTHPTQAESARWREPGG